MSVPEVTKILHNIGESPSKAAHIRANYNTREEVQNAKGLLTFDGVYRNVWENRDILEGRDVVLFVTGDYVGLDNLFDKGMPREQYCSLSELNDLVMLGCKLGWHSKSHRDMTTLTRDEIIDELTPPPYMLCEYFAYPYGKYNDVVLEEVEKRFVQAYSVDATDGTSLTIPRVYV